MLVSGVAIIVIIAIVKMAGGDEDNASNPAELSSQVDTAGSQETNESTQQASEKNLFLADLKKVMDDKVAKKTYRILKNKLGFTE